MALTRKVCSHTTCEVFLVDLGVEIDVPFESIFDIKSRPVYVLRAPMASFQCMIMKVGPGCNLTDLDQEYLLTISCQVKPGLFAGVIERKPRETHIESPTSELISSVTITNRSRRSSNQINRGGHHVNSARSSNSSTSSNVETSGKRTRGGVGRGGKNGLQEELSRLKKEAEELRERNLILKMEKLQVEQECLQRVKAENQTSWALMNEMMLKMEALSARADSLSACVPLASQAMSLCSSYAKAVEDARAAQAALTGMPNVLPPESRNLSINTRARLRDPDQSVPPCSPPSSSLHPVYPSLFPFPPFPANLPPPAPPPLFGSAYVGFSESSLPGMSSGHQGGNPAKNREWVTSGNDSRFVWSTNKTNEILVATGCSKCKKLDHQFDSCPFVWRNPAKSANKEEPKLKEK